MFPKDQQELLEALLAHIDHGYQVLRIFHPVPFLFTLTVKFSTIHRDNPYLTNDRKEIYTLITYS